MEAVIERAKLGDEGAWSVLLEDYGRLVTWLVSQLVTRNSRISIEEADAVAYLAFVEAVHGYAASKGIFVKYMFSVVRYAIKDARIKEAYPHIHAPHKVLRMAHALKSGTYDHKATDLELNRARLYLQCPVLEGDAPLYDDVGTLLDTVASEETPTFLDKDKVTSAIEELPPFQKRIIYGVLGEVPMSEVAYAEGKSRQAAHQQYHKAINTLKEILL